MRRVDVIDLLLLAAIWGSSFLFIRLSVDDFGPIALSGMRTHIAGVTLLPILFLSKKIAVIRTYWRSIIVVGLFNSALPFIFFNFATMTLPAGTMSRLWVMCMASVTSVVFQGWVTSSGL